MPLVRAPSGSSPIHVGVRPGGGELEPLRNLVFPCWHEDRPTRAWAVPAGVHTAKSLSKALARTRYAGHRPLQIIEPDRTELRSVVRSMWPSASYAPVAQFRYPVESDIVVSMRVTEETKRFVAMLALHVRFAIGAGRAELQRYGQLRDYVADGRASRDVVTLSRECPLESATLEDRKSVV